MPLGVAVFVFAWALSLLFATLACASGDIVLPGKVKPEVWFAPFFGFRSPPVQISGSRDYMDLFNPNGSVAVLQHTAVFEVSGNLVLWASDQQLSTIIRGLRRYQIPLALEVGALTRSSGCGTGVEGFDGPGMIKRAARIAQLGGTISYIAMDEPFWYGHVYEGKYACRWTAADIAANVAENIRAVKAIYPRVEIGDIEPVGQANGRDIQSEYSTWIDQFERHTGHSLAFFHADVQWKENWKVPLVGIAALLRARMIPLGIIYNGDGSDATDTAWIANARAHYIAVELDNRVCPDRAVFESWVSHPTHIFPAEDSGSFANLVQGYVSQGHLCFH